MQWTVVDGLVEIIDSSKMQWTVVDGPNFPNLHNFGTKINANGKQYSNSKGFTNTSINHSNNSNNLGLG
jgi:hypothetical protein